MKRLLSFLSLLIVAVSSFAQEFTVDGLTYSVLSETEKTVQLTSAASATGDVVVPTSITVPSSQVLEATWTTQFGPEWTSSVNDEGKTVYTSGTIGDNESTVIRCTFKAKGTIAFMCRYQGENNFDYLTIGNVDATCSRSAYSTSLKGTSGTWKKVVLTPSDENEHYIEFCYSKDGSGKTAPDCAEVYISVFEGGECTVSSISNSISFKNNTNITSVTIPDDFTGFTAVPSQMFYGCTNLKTVNLPSFVETINSEAFRNCSSLESISLPAATSIGSSAFVYCSSLASIELSAATSIGSDAFCSCSSLASVDLPAATSIGSQAFLGCSKINSLRIGSIEQWCNVNFGDYASPLQNTSQTVELYIGDSDTPATSIEVPNTVTSIPDYAFRRTTITSVTAPAATSIGRGAFNVCSSLASVELPAATSIGYNAFSGCSSLAVVELPAATSIGDYAFHGCSSLTSVSLPAATSIGDSAFSGCSSLAAVELPTATSIGNFAFLGCSKINSLRIGSVEQWCNVNLGRYDASPLLFTSKVLLYIGESETPATEITIPASVQQIPQYAFAKADIHTIHFEGTTPPTLVNTNSFQTSTMLAVPEEAYETYLAADIYQTIPLQITIDGHITKEVEMEAAAGTSNLLAKIGENDVCYVVNLKITGTINSYDMLIIRNQMPSLRNLDLTDASIVDCDYIYSNANGVNYHSQQDVVTAEWLSGIMNLKLPTSTKSIADRAFYSNTKLVSVTIPEGVTSIGTYAFYGCDNIKQLTIPQSVTTFGSFAFQSCTGLKEIVIPDGVTSINSDAFFSCTDLQKVTIPASVTSIESYAFNVRNPLELHISSLNDWLNVQNSSYCFNNVAQLFIGDADEPTEDLVIPEGTTNLKNYAFAGFKCLKSVSFPEELTTIGSYAFYNCTGLTGITMPANVTAIKDHTFHDCTNLEEVEFTDGIQSIGSYAFSGCSKLTKIELPAYLQSIGGYAFQSCSNLAQVLIPASITEIKDFAFQGCSNLNRVIATTVEPVKINQNTFSTYQTATLFTPKTSYYKYYWNTQYNQFLGGRKEYDKEFAKVFGYKYFYLNGVNGDNPQDFEITNETGPLHGVGDDNPDADFNEGAGMIVSGEQIQNLGDIHIHHNGNNGASVIAKNSGKVHIDNLYVDIKIQKNRWYFFCFPFDIKPGEATYDGSHVWYLYDGEARALNGNGGWKKVANDGVMKSGNGYIFQGAVNGTLTVHVADLTIDASDSKTNMIAYQSENKNDASWNLIGNANLAYYDIDNLGYDAPITVYNNETGNYQAVRAEDEDYEFYPFQAFFVQKPEGTDTMDFDATKLETKNHADATTAVRAAARAGAPKKVDPSRQLINLELSAVNLTEDAETATAADRTRIVVNAAKSLAYEPECDAAKFIADGMPQIYSLDTENTMYAINERPAADGIVPLAVKAPKTGTYTISATRLDCDAKLRDLETGDVIDLAEGEYTFLADAKTYTNRFELLLTHGTLTSITTLEDAVAALSVENGAISVNDANAEVTVYTAGGVLVASQKGVGSVSVPAGVYVVNVGGQTIKVTVNE